MVKGRFFPTLAVISLCLSLSSSTILNGKNRLFSIRGGNNVEDRFDYIIVGGGVAGCVLANRLTEDGSNKVILLEAGKSVERKPTVNIPSGIIKLIRSRIDWCYSASPEPGLRGKEVFLCRGKALGGSSNVNAMLVHRGAPADYAAWESKGAVGWGPKDVLPYFRSSENYKPTGNYEYHANSGLYAVDSVKYRNPLTDMFFQACHNVGIKFNPDFNDWSHDQDGYGPFKVSQSNGRRWTAANSYLKAALKRGKGLDVASEALVTRVIFQGKKAVGVEYRKGGSLRSAHLKDNGEVLLCGGAINSPQVLLLSGVGPKDQLERFNIPQVVESPGVGQNLVDHPAVVVAHDVTKKIAITDDLFVPGTSIPKPSKIIQWMFTGRGPLTSSGCDNGAFVRTQQSLDTPDIQLRFVSGRGNDPDGIKAYENMGLLGQRQSGVTFQVVAIRPKSRGQVSLKSADPNVKPRIDINYLSHPADMATLKNGLRLARRIMSQKVFDGVRGKEVFPGHDVEDEEAVEEYIRTTIHSANALVGTCKMGKATDPMAVVDPELKVIGASNIRVVDSSVMPTIPGGQTGAPTVMIAEKAADMLKSLPK